MIRWNCAFASTGDLVTLLKTYSEDKLDNQGVKPLDLTLAISYMEQMTD